MRPRYPGLVAARATLLAVEDRAVRRSRDLLRHPRLEQIGLRRRVRLAAVGAELARESLREHGRDRRAGQERLDAHLAEARDRGGRVVRMQRREDEVPREGGFDRDLGGLRVADLPDHDHVGIRAQDRPQRRREREPRADVDLHLVHARQAVLDGILDRDDVDLRPVDLREAGIERRRLAGSGRAGDQQRARRHADDRREPLAHRLREAELEQRRRSPATCPEGA